MSVIHVCPLSQLEATLAASCATHVITLLTTRLPEGLAGFAPSKLLRLEISDITAPREGHVLPAEAHMTRLIAFVRDWDRAGPLLIHCYAGVSRSTAAAFIAQCVLAPATPEAALATALRQASPTATPNPHLIALADAALGRSGRMIAAIAAIGRGADCFEGQSFSLPAL